MAFYLMDATYDGNVLSENDFIYIYDNAGVLRAKLPVIEVGGGEASAINIGGGGD